MRQRGGWTERFDFVGLRSKSVLTNGDFVSFSSRPYMKTPSIVMFLPKGEIGGEHGDGRSEPAMVETGKERTWKPQVALHLTLYLSIAKLTGAEYNKQKGLIVELRLPSSTSCFWHLPRELEGSL